MKKRGANGIVPMLVLVLCLSVFVGCGKTDTEERYDGVSYGLGAYNSLDDLSALKNDILFEQQSSYDRDGGNVDAFGLVLPDGANNSGEPSGEESAIRRVLLDVQSPGVVYRMWFTNFGEVPNLRIYVDGTKVVDMSVADLTSGKQYPFVAPFVQDKTQSSGGMVCYLPIVFSESIKIIGSGSFYYNIDYHVYPSDAELQPFRMDMDVSKAAKILENVSQDPKYKGDNTYKKQEFTVKAGETQSVAVKGKRRISSLEMKIPAIKTVVSDRTIYSDDGVRMSAGSSIAFTMRVADAAALTGRFVLLKESQRAGVTVDGVKTDGFTIRSRRQDGFEWKDDTYFEDYHIVLPDSLTTGKERVTVRITAETDMYIYGLWTKGRNNTVDTFDIGKDADDTAHGLQKTGTVTSAVLTAEYDPNSLLSDAQKQAIFADEDVLNRLYIKIYFDGKSEPDVNAPVSAFFGFGNFGAYQTLSLMTGLRADGTMYCYYPMPFGSECRIELENKGSAAVRDLQLNIGHAPFSGDMREHGYFATQYNEYVNGTETMLRPGEYFNVLKTGGAGHLVGVTLSMTGNYFGETSRYYLEGDEVGYIDGNMSHSLHGTGTEDFFNGGWYFNNGTQVNALYGNPVHNYRNGLDRTVMVRSLAADCIPFRDGIEFVFEHGGSNNRTDSNVYVLAYYYHSDQARLKKTDSFSVVKEKEATAHGYTMSAGDKFPYTGTLEALYKQKSYPTEFHHVTGASQFRVAVDATNRGVILRRFMNADILEQVCTVYVDGEKVGIWNERQRAALGFVRFEDFLLPAKYTAGKTEITVRLENTSEASQKVAWTEGGYTALCIV